MLSRVALGARAAARVAAAPAAPRRAMSGHGSPEEIFQHKELWLKTSIAMTVAIILPYTVFVLYKELTHHHHDDHAPIYPHMRIRRKAFFWEPADCTLFDRKCVAQWYIDHPKGGAAVASARH